MKYKTEYRYIFKRLKMLEPLSNDWKWFDISLTGHDRINFKDRYEGKNLCDGGCVLFENGKSPVNERIKEIAQSVINDASPVFDFLDRLLLCSIDHTEGSFHIRQEYLVGYA